MPTLVVPVLKTSAPLIPAVPALTDWTTIDPLDVSRPIPADKDICPPVAVVDDPAVALTCPPTPVFPVPTAITISPPFPFVAAPVAKKIFPDDPALVVPVMN